MRQFYLERILLARELIQGDDLAAGALARFVGGLARVGEDFVIARGGVVPDLEPEG